jgi:hypothetical protein
MNNYLKLFGELMSDIYYIMSPFILCKLFLLTIIITDTDVESIMLFVASICIIIMCYSTSIYRVFKISIEKKK